MVYAAHHAKNVVVGRIHAHLGGVGGVHRVVRHRQEQSGVINTGQVAAATGLVLLRLQGERIHVHANCRDVGVVLEGLH